MKFVIRKIETFLKLTFRQKKIVLVVLLLSIFRNILILLGSKKAFTEHICKKGSMRNMKQTEESFAIAADISLAINLVNYCVPWKNVCRHQSWQAVLLLLYYKIPFEFTVGINKNKTTNEGHSWVNVEDKFICGKCNKEDYFIVFFSKK